MGNRCLLPKLFVRFSRPLVALASHVYVPTLAQFLVPRSPPPGIIGRGLDCSIRLIGENMITEPDLTECSNPNRPYIISIDHSAKTGIVFRPRCKMWTCPFCAEENAANWRMHAMRGVSYFQERGLDLSFITLTSRGGKGRTRERSLETFRRNFPRFRKRVVYAYDLFEYIAVPEQHLNGVVHMHLIATYHGTQKFIKDKAFASGFGYIADVRIVDSGPAAAAYLSKYIGKDFISLKWPPRFRRVRCSRSWPRMPEEQVEDDRVHEALMSWFDARVAIDHYELRGYEIEQHHTVSRDN